MQVRVGKGKPLPYGCSQLKKGPLNLVESIVGQETLEGHASSWIIGIFILTFLTYLNLQPPLKPSLVVVKIFPTAISGLLRMTFFVHDLWSQSCFTMSGSWLKHLMLVTVIALDMIYRPTSWMSLGYARTCIARHVAKETTYYICLKSNGNIYRSPFESTPCAEKLARPFEDSTSAFWHQTPRNLASMDGWMGT